MENGMIKAQGTFAQLQEKGEREGGCRGGRGGRGTTCRWRSRHRALLRSCRRRVRGVFRGGERWEGRGAEKGGERKEHNVDGSKAQGTFAQLQEKGEGEVTGKW